ncbi:MAG: hypothetical protein V3S37_01855, partial [Dehalococcoidia bacterium]
MINVNTAKHRGLEHQAWSRMVSMPTGKAALMAAVMLAAGGFVFLAALASQQSFTNADLQIASWVKGLDFPGLHTALGAVNVFTDAQMAIALWVVAGAFFVLRSRPLEAIAVFMLIALVPAFGAIAYVASDTMTKKGLGRLLVDQAAYKMPFSLYRRLNLARITSPRLQGPA